MEKLQSLRASNGRDLKEELYTRSRPPISKREAEDAAWAIQFTSSISRIADNHQNVIGLTTEDTICIHLNFGIVNVKLDVVESGRFRLQLGNLFGTNKGAFDPPAFPIFTGGVWSPKSRCKAQQ